MTILEALKTVASHCDGARMHDCVGFSGQDAIFGNKLAALDSLSPKQEMFAAKFVRKYRKQIASRNGIGVDLKGKAREAAVEAFVAGLTWTHPTFDFNHVPAPVSGGKVNALLSDSDNSLKSFVVRFPYSPEKVAAIKSLPNRTFTKDNNDPRWIIGTSAGDIAGLVSMIRDFNLTTTPATEEILQSLRKRSLEAA